MGYHEVLPLERDELENLIGSGNEAAVVEALLSAAFFDPDWRWVQQLCVSHLEDMNENVRCNAAICLGHVARIHGRIELEMIVPRLKSMLADPVTGPYAEDALDDIAHFVRRQ